MEQPGQFDLGLEECAAETSPDFDESKTKMEPPTKKAQQRKVATKKEQGRLVKEVRAHVCLR